MNLREVLDTLTRAAPFECSWTKEPYGGQNINMVREAKVVRKILYCVTPTSQVIEEFRVGGYDLLVSHHPFPIPVDVPACILHTALDCCPGGLNDQWSAALGVINPRHFDKNLGWAGYIEPISFEGLRARVEKFIGERTVGVCYSDLNRPIQSVVICTGLGGMVETTALATGADCYILGQATRNPLESKFPAMIEVGHTLTEKSTGLEFLRRVLPFTISIRGAAKGGDYYGSEVYRSGSEWLEDCDD